MPELSPETRRQYELEREQANVFARFYFNLRVVALSFVIIATGAISAFGWNAVFKEAYESLNTQERTLRFIIFGLVAMTLWAGQSFERTIGGRHQIAWNVARKYEGRLLGEEKEEGMHRRISSARNDTGLRHTTEIIFWIFLALLTSAILVEAYNVLSLVFGG